MKKIDQLHKALGVTSVDELKAACEAGRVRQVKGFGAKSEQKILEARDHVLANNPQLRMVGVHLGSMERDLDNIARHLDKYPNFAIDTAARMRYLMLMPPKKVRAFLIKYQDRVLYGTDLDFLPDASPAEVVKDWQSSYARDWNFLATSDIFYFRCRQLH